METMSYVGERITHMLKCMLENDVFFNVKPIKIKEYKEIEGQKNIKKISA